MAEFEGHTRLICDALGIGWQTAFNLTVEKSPIADSGQMTRTWNGGKINLADPMFRLYEIRISSGADDWRPPALLKMWPGTELTIITPDEDGVVIPVGGTTAVFERDIHEARALTMRFDDVAHTVVGQTVVLDAPAAEPVRVFAMLRHDVMVTEPWRKTFREADTSYSWQLATEEVGGF
ncbi:hypothetical protein HJB51_28920 [Rhizobium lentis]|uniref:hypothetical protein n=1 Tax=Rhizobium lentis TaxID=1138194 RepID=UPI001C82C7AA|nr:hypothetical protein [Rhizobium lentis]MBX5111955.1 hypothetical protein [Rhizobium lentis]